MGGAWAPRTRRGRGPGDSPPTPRVPGFREGAVPEDPPEGAQDSERAPQTRQAGPPAPGGQAHDPPPPSRCLCFPSAATQCCTNPRAPAAPLYTAAEGGSEGAQPQALPFFYFFFFCLWKREEQSVRFCPIYVSTWEQTLVVCVCFFLCWFFKEMGRRKKKKPPVPFLALAPLLPSFQDPSSRLFCSVVLFCYESTFLFVILGSPGFLFSVKSCYASSALCLLLPPPGPDGLGRAWLARSPPPSLASFPLLPPPLLGGGEPAYGRGLAHLALSERHLGAPGLGAD